jgi:ketosteroid isomerase-like protein
MRVFNLLSAAIVLTALTLSPNAWPAKNTQSKVLQPRERADLECTVWFRETQFAASVARHDEKAFRSFIRGDAIFNIAGKEPQRGIEAIVQAWRDIIVGKNIKLRWRPDMVRVNEAGTLAYSAGPTIIEDTTTPGKTAYSIGRYSSIWQRDENLIWQVLFDGGNGPSQPVESLREAEVSFTKTASSCPTATH